MTKTRKGAPGDVRILEAKIFADHENPETCYVRTLLEYDEKKTPQQKHPDSPYFLNCKQSAVLNPSAEKFWYIGKGKESSGIMGKHKLESLVTDALSAAGIDCKLEKYSAISTRKALLQGGVDAGVPDTHLSRLAGHKSVNSKGEYISSKGNAHKAAVLSIQRRNFGLKSRNYAREFEKYEQEASYKSSVLRGEIGASSSSFNEDASSLPSSSTKIPSQHQVDTRPSYPECAAAANNPGPQGMPFASHPSCFSFPQLWMNSFVPTPSFFPTATTPYMVPSPYMGPMSPFIMSPSMAPMMAPMMAPSFSTPSPPLTIPQAGLQMVTPASPPAADQGDVGLPVEKTQSPSSKAENTAKCKVRVKNYSMGLFKQSYFQEVSAQSVEDKKCSFATEQGLETKLVRK